MARRKRGRRRGKRIFYIIMGIPMFVALIYFIVTYLFVVKEVKVSGNEHYDDKKIQDLILNDDYSENSLYVYLKYRFSEPEELPFVESMNITLNSPGTIHIKVNEKQIIGYLYLEQFGQNVYFDHDGFVVETSSETIRNVPRIEGIHVDEIVLYEKLSIKEDSILRDLLSLTMMLKKYDVIPDSIQYISGEGYHMEYSNLVVNLGTTDYLNDKILRLESFMPKYKDIPGILHMEDYTVHRKNIRFEKIDDK